MCFFGIVTRLLILIYGTLWPALHTYSSMVKKQDDEFHNWSKYWIIYGMLIFLEHLVDFFFSWMPLYVFSKLVLVIWIVVAAPQASVWVYDAIVGPLLSKRQQQIDNILLHGRKRIFTDCFAIATELMVHLRQGLMPLLVYIWSTINSRLRWNYYEWKIVAEPPKTEPKVTNAITPGNSVYLSPSNSETSLSDSETPVEFHQVEAKLGVSVAKTKLQPSLAELAKKTVDMNPLSRRGQRKHLHMASKSLRQTAAAAVDDSGDEDKMNPKDEIEHQLNEATMERKPADKQLLQPNRVV